MGITEELNELNNKRQTIKDINSIKELREQITSNNSSLSANNLKIKRVKDLNEYYEWDLNRSKENDVSIASIGVDATVVRLNSKFKVDLSENKALILEDQIKEDILPTDLQSAKRFFTNKGNDSYYIKSENNKDNYYAAKARINQLNTFLAEQIDIYNNKLDIKENKVLYSVDSNLEASQFYWDINNPNAFSNSIIESIIEKANLDREDKDKLPTLTELKGLYDDKFKTIDYMAQLYELKKKDEPFPVIENEQQLANVLDSISEDIEKTNIEKVKFNEHLDNIKISHGNELKEAYIPTSIDDFNLQKSALKGPVDEKEFNIKLETMLEQYNKHDRFYDSKTKELVDPPKALINISNYEELFDASGLIREELQNTALSINENIKAKVDTVAKTGKLERYSKLRDDIDKIIDLSNKDKDFSYAQNAATVDRLINNLRDKGDITVNSVDELVILANKAKYDKKYKDEVDKNKNAINVLIKGELERRKAAEKEESKVVRFDGKLFTEFKDVLNAEKEIAELTGEEKVRAEEAYKANLKSWNEYNKSQLNKYLVGFVMDYKRLEALSNNDKDKYSEIVAKMNDIKTQIPETKFNEIADKSNVEKPVNAEIFFNSLNTNIEDYHKDLPDLIDLPSVENLIKEDRGLDGGIGYSESEVNKQIEKNYEAKLEDIISKESDRLKYDEKNRFSYGKMTIPETIDEFRAMSMDGQVLACRIINENRKALPKLDLPKLEDVWDSYLPVIQSRNKDIKDEFDNNKKFKFVDSFKDIIALESKNKAAYDKQINQMVILYNKMIDECNPEKNSGEVKTVITRNVKDGKVVKTNINGQEKGIKSTDKIAITMINPDSRREAFSYVDYNQMADFVKSMQEDKRNESYRASGKDAAKISSLDKKLMLMYALKDRMKDAKFEIDKSEKEQIGKIRFISFNKEEKADKIIDKMDSVYSEDKKAELLSDYEKAKTEKALYEKHKSQKALAKRFAETRNYNAPAAISFMAQAARVVTVSPKEDKAEKESTKEDVDNKTILTPEEAKARGRKTTVLSENLDKLEAEADNLSEEQNTRRAGFSAAWRDRVSYRTKEFEDSFARNRTKESDAGVHADLASEGRKNQNKAIREKESAQKKYDLIMNCGQILNNMLNHTREIAAVQILAPLYQRTKEAYDDVKDANEAVADIYNLASRNAMVSGHNAERFMRRLYENHNKAKENVDEAKDNAQNIRGQLEEAADHVKDSMDPFDEARNNEDALTQINGELTKAAADKLIGDKVNGANVNLDTEYKNQVINTITHDAMGAKNDTDERLAEEALRMVTSGELIEEQAIKLSELYSERNTQLLSLMIKAGGAALSMAGVSLPIDNIAGFITNGLTNFIPEQITDLLPDSLKDKAKGLIDKIKGSGEEAEDESSEDVENDSKDDESIEDDGEENENSIISDLVNAGKDSKSAKGLSAANNISEEAVGEEDDLNDVQAMQRKATQFFIALTGVFDIIHEKLDELAILAEDELNEAIMDEAAFSNTEKNQAELDIDKRVDDLVRLYEDINKVDNLEERENDTESVAALKVKFQQERFHELANNIKKMENRVAAREMISMLEKSMRGLENIKGRIDLDEERLAEVNETIVNLTTVNTAYDDLNKACKEQIANIQNENYINPVLQLEEDYALAKEQSDKKLDELNQKFDAKNKILKEVLKDIDADSFDTVKQLKDEIQKINDDIAKERREIAEKLVKKDNDINELTDSFKEINGEEELDKANRILDSKRKEAEEKRLNKAKENNSELENKTIENEVDVTNAIQNVKDKIEEERKKQNENYINPIIKAEQEYLAAKEISDKKLREFNFNKLVKEEALVKIKSELADDSFEAIINLQAEIQELEENITKETNDINAKESKKNNDIKALTENYKAVNGEEKLELANKNLDKKRKGLIELDPKPAKYEINEGEKNKAINDEIEKVKSGIAVEQSEIENAVNIQKKVELEAQILKMREQLLEESKKLKDLENQYQKANIFNKRSLKQKLIAVQQTTSEMEGTLTLLTELQKNQNSSLSSSVANDKEGMQKLLGDIVQSDFDKKNKFTNMLNDSSGKYVQEVTDKRLHDLKADVDVEKISLRDLMDEEAVSNDKINKRKERIQQKTQKKDATKNPDIGKN